MGFTRMLGRCMAALTLVTVGAASAQDIRFAFNGDISATPAAAAGQAAVLGMRTAIEDINAAGGLLGRKVMLVVRDDLGQPPKAIQNTNELLDNQKITAMFGPSNSGNGLAWRHIPNQKKVPVMGILGGATELTKPMSPGAENYMFRVSMVDRYQVAALMAYAKKTADSAGIGILTENTGWGQAGLIDLQQIAELNGLRVAVSERVGSNDTDMTSQLSKMKTAGVKTIFIWCNGTPTAQVMRSMEKLNYYPQVLSSWSADNFSFYGAAGKTLAELPLFMRTFAGKLTPQQEKFRARIDADLKDKGAITFALHGHDGVMLMAEAVRQAGSTDGAAIKQALENLQRPVEGLLKTYVKPYSKTDHEGLDAVDLVWTHWRDAKMEPYSDAVTTSLQASDFKY